MSDPLTRREFLLRASRGLLAAVLLLGAGALVARKSKETCTSDGICTSCGELHGCGLPQALSTRHELAKKR